MVYCGIISFMRAVQRARGFCQGADVGIEKARLVQSLKAFAHNGMPLRINGDAFSPHSKEQDVNISLLAHLSGKPLRAQVYSKEGKKHYLVGTIGHSFELDGVLVSLIVDVRTNSSMLLDSSFVVYPEDQGRRLTIDVYIDTLDAIVPCLAACLFDQNQSRPDQERIIADLAVSTVVKELFRAKLFCIFGNHFETSSAVALMTPSAWGLPFHPYFFAQATRFIPNQEAHLRTLGVAAVEDIESAPPERLRRFALDAFGYFKERTGVDPSDLVTIGHILRLNQEFLGLPSLLC